MHGEGLQKELRKATGALLAVAILQAVFGTVLVAMAPDVPEKTILYVFVYGIAVLFFGLYIWARHNPFPAAIAGLVLFVTMHLLDAIADPAALVRGILVKVIVVIVLARAVSAGARYRKMQMEVSGASLHS